MDKCAGGVKFDMRGTCPECGSGTQGPCWRDYSNHIKLEAAARNFIKTGLRLVGNPPKLTVIESADKSDPHFKLCEALEAIAPLNP